jgi:hypothetical protein
MAERRPEWQALGFSSPEAYEDAKAASKEMLKIEYLMGVQDKLPEGYKMNQGPGKVLTALGLYGDQTDNPQFSQPANIRSYTRPIGGDGHRTLGRYVVPYQNYDGAMSLPEYEEALSRKHSGVKAAMLGGPTQGDDVFADLTMQYDGQGYSYEDVLKHELRHRGRASERVQDYLKQRDPEEKDPTAGRGEHELYELIRQLQVGETSPEDLFMWDQRKLGQLEDLEAEILEGMTEEQRMKLGFLPEEPGFLDKLMGIMD